MSDLVSPEYQGCVDGSLMDGFSVFIQGLLAVLAFSTLMRKLFSLFKPNRNFFFPDYGYDIARGLGFVCLQAF